MLLSTLPDLPGRTYDVVGVVFDCGDSSASVGNQIRPPFLEKMFNSIVRQASDMGADAIVDIKMTAPSGTDRSSAYIVVIGTAVKLR